jgi:hypothetical protein
MPVLEPDEEKFEPKLQTQASGDGVGQPPRRTAIGLSEDPPGPQPAGPLTRWQRVLAKTVMFMLGISEKTNDD